MLNKRTNGIPCCLIFFHGRITFVDRWRSFCSVRRYRSGSLSSFRQLARAVWLFSARNSTLDATIGDCSRELMEWPSPLQACLGSSTYWDQPVDGKQNHIKTKSCPKLNRACKLNWFQHKRCRFYCPFSLRTNRRSVWRFIVRSVCNAICDLRWLFPRSLILLVRHRCVGDRCCFDLRTDRGRFASEVFSFFQICAFAVVTLAYGAIWIKIHHGWRP